MRIRRGLRLPWRAAPVAPSGAIASVTRVAVLGGDLAGLAPRPCVRVGQRVRLGEPLLTCGAREGLRVTAPAAGRVETIARGARRALEAVVVACEGNDEDEVVAPVVAPDDGPRPDRARLVDGLLASGLWLALRERPFGGVARPESRPVAILVTAMDTRPFALDVSACIARSPRDFARGLRALAALTDGPVHVCVGPGGVPALPPHERVGVVVFEGPHPAGLPGTHVARLVRVASHRVAWHVGAQDVLAIGRFAATGRLLPRRSVVLARPGRAAPVAVDAPLGASLRDLLGAPEDDARMVAGCVLHGHEGAGNRAFLGRWHEHAAHLPAAGATPAPWPTTALHGRRGPMLPVGAYRRVWPFRTPAAALLRALLVGDAATAVALGALALDAEDLAACTYVCPSKQDHGANLRRLLDRMEREA